MQDLMRFGQNESWIYDFLVRRWSFDEFFIEEEKYNILMIFSQIYRVQIMLNWKRIILVSYEERSIYSW